MVTTSKLTPIRMLLDKYRMSVEDLSKQTGLSNSTIARLVSGSEKDVRLSSIKPIAQYFKISYEEALGEVPLKQKAGDDDVLTESSSIIQVPLVHWENILEEDFNSEKLDFNNWKHWTPTLADASKVAFALVINNSAFPTAFNDGVIAIIDPMIEARNEDFVLIFDNKDLGEVKKQKNKSNNADHIPNEKNPIICQFFENGLEKIYKNLITESFIDKAEFVGTMIQYTSIRK